MDDTLAALRAFALRYPEVAEGVACEGTPLERRTLKARGKAFLFLGAADLLLKLGPTLEAAAARPGVRAGAHGWVTVALDAAAPARETLEAWVDESYRLVAPRKLIAGLPDRGPPQASGRDG